MSTTTAPQIVPLIGPPPADRSSTRRRRVPRWWAYAAGAAAGLSLLVVTALWVSNGGVQEVASGGWQTVTAIGRWTGLLASDLMVMQVLLLARIPMVERAFGQDRLVGWHRWLGFLSFNLMLIHIVLITLGYAGLVNANPFAQFWSLILTYPGMLLAAAGSALLVLVVVISIRVARRRLRYESWHLLHLYTYLGLGLALPHQIWTGVDFRGSSAAQVYWWTLYATAAGAMLVFRVGLPLLRNYRHRLRVAAVVPEGRGTTSVYLRGRDLDRLPTRAGQFFLWRFLDGPGWSRANPYSLSRPPQSDLLRITVKQLGDGSSRVAKLKPGTRVLIEGPYGRLTGDTYQDGPVTMFASGIGITPLLALLWELPYRDGEATLVYRARTKSDLTFRAELDWLAEHRGVRIVYRLGRRAKRRSWQPAKYADKTDIDAVRELVPDIPHQHVFVRGPEAWTSAVIDAVLAAGLPANRLHTERFTW